MNKKNYQAVLFAPDGDKVTDFKNQPTIKDVWDLIENMGSKWFFYPLCFVATEKTIVSAPNGFKFFEGKRIETVKKILRTSQLQY